MANEATTRHLTAILSADVVGYSRLIELDEIETLKVHRECVEKVFAPRVSEYSGHIVKTIGDGVLIEFSSAVNAVNCAINIQEDLKAFQTSIGLGQKIEFRIGINLGDIIHENGDIFGEGVNVAARIEALAKPGGVLISRSVFEQTDGKCDCRFKDLGRRELKNISNPVQVFEVCSNNTELASDERSLQFSRRKFIPKILSGVFTIVLVVVMAVYLTSRYTADSSSPAVVANPDAAKPTIAVLPFINMSDDSEQEYFVDGMTEDLITDLSRISALSVIARSSSFAYKGETPDISEVASALNVSHVVEGSVRKVGTQIRFTATLIEASSGNHLWAERYDRNLDDIFAVQDEVRNRIISALTVQLTSEEERRLASPLTDNAEAYDLYLRGIGQESFFTPESFYEAEDLFKRAIALDPDFAAAYAHLAQVYTFIVENYWTDEIAEVGALAISAAEKAIELDGELPYAYWSLGRIYTRSFARNMNKAISSFEKAIELNSNYADGYVFLGLSHAMNGEAAKGLPYIERGFRINPHAPMWYYQGLGVAQFYIGNYEAAIKSFEQTVEKNATLPFPYPYLISAYGHLGLIDDAEWMLMEYEALGQPNTITEIIERRSTSDPVYLKIFEDGLRKAGLEEG